MKAKIIIALLFVFVSTCWAKNDKDLITYAIPTPLQNKQSNLDSLVQNNMKSLEKGIIILLHRKQKDGSYKMLPVLIVHDKDLAKKNMVQRYDETDNFSEKQLSLLKEIEDYQKAIKKAEHDLEQLKEVRDIMQNNLSDMKNKVKKSSKTRLNRSE
ncbi:hypothetical protein JW960_16825 [candidate division KSB1 bacterium]|nr:hypothetical protein [candidate division KSB1 bacterium]